jgi:hypothetical protein
VKWEEKQWCGTLPDGTRIAFPAKSLWYTTGKTLSGNDEIDETALFEESEADDARRNQHKDCREPIVQP